MSKRLTTEQFIERAKEVHSDKYDYSLVDYKNSKTKVTIICPVHGEFEQIAGYHIHNRGCSKCAGVFKPTTEQFIEHAKEVHGDRYSYKSVVYKNSKTKVTIVCPVHGEFDQQPNGHLNGCGCPKCGLIKRSSTIDNFITKSKDIHDDRYNYSLVDYKNCDTKVTIICPVHGEFEQTPSNHHQGHGCRKCKFGYSSNNIPLYDTYAKQLEPYGVKCRRSPQDTNILEVKCVYCDKWHQPTKNSVKSKIFSFHNLIGDNNLYCGHGCKMACPTYKKVKYPKGFKKDTSREVQPALRKLVLERDNWTCQKCESTEDGLHCHHMEGIEINPVESADIDMCITLCKDCHNKLHKRSDCNMKRKKCLNS